MIIIRMWAGGEIDEPAFAQWVRARLVQAS